MPLPFRMSIHAAVLATSVMCLPATTEAQAWSLAAGPSVPQGPMSERRTVGAVKGLWDSVLSITGVGFSTA
jgi:hypothetical protein